MPNGSARPLQQVPELSYGKDLYDNLLPKNSGGHRESHVCIKV
jgi:hypothetical protein